MSVDQALAGPVRQAPASAPDGRPATAAVRLFAGFAGLGAGTVNLAISSSFFAGVAGFPAEAAYAAGGLAGLWGAGLLTASVLHLARGHLPGLRAGTAALLAATGVHVAAMALGTPAGSILDLSHLAALLLTLMVIAARAWLHRSGSGNGGAGRTASGAQPGRLLLAAFAGALLVAGITTPGLAASAAGQSAVPHGGHGSTPPAVDHHGR